MSQQKPPSLLPQESAVDQPLMAAGSQVKDRSKATPNKLSKLSDKSWYELSKDILVPIAAILVGGWFTWSQFLISNERQDADSADQEIETREQVLTDYSKVIADLMTKNEEGTYQTYTLDQDKASIARGQTLIALRRLNPEGKAKENNRDQPQEGNSSSNSLLPDLPLNNPVRDGESDAIEGDQGELKGLLIRYLYELHLIDNYEDVPPKGRVPDKANINLGGADVDNVVLKDAWLPSIDLTGAWLRHSDLRNANLRRATLINVKLTQANLTQADLTQADLRGADLRFANLTSTNLADVNLTAACYVQGSEAQSFPPGFSPESHQMVAIPAEKSDPATSAFEPCPPVPLP